MCCLFEGDIDFASSEELVLAWWGSTSQPSSDHLLAIDLETDTIILKQSMGFTKALLKPEMKLVVEIFSNSGTDSNNFHSTMEPVIRIVLHGTLKLN